MRLIARRRVLCEVGYTRLSQIMSVGSGAILTCTSWLWKRIVLNFIVTKKSAFLSSCKKFVFAFCSTNYFMSSVRKLTKALPAKYFFSFAEIYSSLRSIFSSAVFIRVSNFSIILVLSDCCWFTVARSSAFFYSIKSYLFFSSYFNSLRS